MKNKIIRLSSLISIDAILLRKARYPSFGHLAACRNVPFPPEGERKKSSLSLWERGLFRC
jgi:hypothetical protein